MIRPLIATDRSPVIELLRATSNFSPQELDVAAELMDAVVDNPAQKDYYAFVEEQAEQVRGLLILGPVPATAGTWDMYWIAVHPDFYGQGVAQSLERWAESMVRERQGYWLLAETSSQPGYERTRAFYVKQGYAVLARIADYYKPADDLIVFGKRLS